MRACTSTHLFQETSPSHYTQNAFSAIFVIPANRDMFKQMYDFLGQGVYAMPRFLESTKYQNPTDYNNSPFQFWSPYQSRFLGILERGSRTCENVQ